MPIIEVHLLEGCSVDQKRRMARVVADAVVESLDVPRHTIRILVHEVAADDYSVGGVTFTDLQPAPGTGDVESALPE